MKNKKYVLLVYKGLWALDTCKFLVKALFCHFQPSLILSRCLNFQSKAMLLVSKVPGMSEAVFHHVLWSSASFEKWPPFYRWQNWVVRRPCWWTIHAKYNYQLFIPTCINHFCLGGEVMADTCPLTKSRS